MIRAIQTGFQGMERASNLVNGAAKDIASSATAAPSSQSPPSNATQGGDITRDMVNLMVGRTTYDANAKVVEVAARTLDKII